MTVICELGIRPMAASRLFSPRPACMLTSLTLSPDGITESGLRFSLPVCFL